MLFGGRYGRSAPLSSRRYLDVTPELDRDMANLLIETEHIDSDLNGEVWKLGDWAIYIMGRTLGDGSPQL